MIKFERIHWACSKRRQLNLQFTCLLIMNTWQWEKIFCKMKIKWIYKQEKLLEFRREIDDFFFLVVIWLLSKSTKNRNPILASSVFLFSVRWMPIVFEQHPSIKYPNFNRNNEISMIEMLVLFANHRSQINQMRMYVMKIKSMFDVRRSHLSISSTRNKTWHCVVVHESENIDILSLSLVRRISINLFDWQNFY